MKEGEKRGERERERAVVVAALRNKV